MEEDDKYKERGHTWYLDKNCGKQVCAFCGLIALRNQASDWCVQKGCFYKLHPSYQKTIRKLTKQFNF